MRVLAIVHETEAGPGVFADAIRERGGTLDEWLVPQPAEPLGYDAVLVLGGSMNADEGERFHWIGKERELVGRLLERRVPLMGLCLGGQMVAAAAGAVPRRAAEAQAGSETTRRSEPS